MKTEAIHEKILFTAFPGKQAFQDPKKEVFVFILLIIPSKACFSQADPSPE
jgi:hypothetical protein